MKKLVLLILTLVLVASLTLVVVPTPQVKGAILTVPGMYPTIQAALDDASPGDTVQVAPGNYYEMLFMGTPNVNLMGAGAIQTKILTDDEWAIDVHASGVTIANLGIMVGGEGWNDGIVLDEVEECTIRDCRIEMFEYATGACILVLDSYGCEIHNNRLISHMYPPMDGNEATFHLSQWTGESWVEKYEHHFPVDYATEQFEFNVIDGAVKLRIVQDNIPFGDVEQALLTVDGDPLIPSYAIYTSDGRSVMEDIIEIDNNVAVAHEQEIEICWDIPDGYGGTAILSLTANEYGGGTPLRFPAILSLDGLAHYAMGSNPGSIEVDGYLTETDGIDNPLYTPYWTPASGHPDGFTYIYVSDDEENVYISLDVTPDNTDDPNADWARITIFPNGSEYRSFYLDETDTTWGKMGFGPTSKAGYNHQTCEFRLPKSIVGDESFDFTLQYYGTASGPPVEELMQFSGIVLINSAYCGISNNNIGSSTDGAFVSGISLMDSYQNFLLNNNIQLCYFGVVVMGEEFGPTKPEISGPAGIQDGLNSSPSHDPVGSGPLNVQAPIEEEMAAAMVNCNISRNMVGVYSIVPDDVILMTNCTIADFGIGILTFQPSYMSVLLTNSIVWGVDEDWVEMMGGGPPPGPITEMDEGTCIVNYCDIEGGWPGTGNIDSAPDFVNPSSGNFHIQGTSPCLNKGSNDAPFLPPQDFDGDPRIMGNKVDIGADETIAPTPIEPIGPMWVSLKVSVYPESAGIVTRNPEGVPTASVFSYSLGQLVELTAAPSSGYLFDGWTGDATGDNPATSFVMDNYKEVTAHFIPIAPPTQTPEEPAQGGTPAPTVTPTPTPTPTPSPSPSPTPTLTPSPTPTTTPGTSDGGAPGPTVTPTPTPTPTPTTTPTSGTPKPTQTSGPTTTPESDNGDDGGGLPWWVILLIILGALGIGGGSLWWWWQGR